MAKRIISNGQPFGIQTVRGVACQECGNDRCMVFIIDEFRVCGGCLQTVAAKVA